MLPETEGALLSVIREAGKIILDAQDISKCTNEKNKDAANMVTAYDVAVQKFLIKKISAILPDACFFAEEKQNNAGDLDCKYCFVIDPIDGTANFVHNYHKSSISVALFSFGKVIFGAVYDPYLDEMFWASEGKGAYLNHTPIRVSDRDMPHAFVAFGTSPYFKKELSQKSFALAHALYTQTSDVRRAGSAAIDLAYLAAGRNDIFFEFTLYPWDFAAGSIIITEAGGIITDFTGNKVDFKKPSPIFAAAAQLCDEAFKTVRSVLG